MAEPSFSHRPRWYQFRLRSLLLLTTLLILVLVGWRIYVAPRVAYYRDLEFPELRRRSPDEIHVLRRQLAALKAQYDRIDNFRKAGVIGGDRFHLAGAAYGVASAQRAMRGQGAREPAEVNGKRVKQFAQSTPELYERSISDDVQYETIEIEVRKLESLNTCEVAEVAGETGIVRRLPSKAAALDEIRQMIEQRKESFQRTASN